MTFFSYVIILFFIAKNQPLTLQCGGLAPFNYKRVNETEILFKIHSNNRKYAFLKQLENNQMSIEEKINILRHNPDFYCSLIDNTPTAFNIKNGGLMDDLF
jgi:hypothetical protein